MAFTPEQSAAFQAVVQSELERREWAESDDNVMAEYITVLLANGSERDRVQSEMEDLVGPDFDPSFLDWLFAKSAAYATPAAALPPIPIPPASASASASPGPLPIAPASVSPAPASAPAPGSSNRLLSTALGTLSSQPAEKRKLPDSAQDGANKRPAQDVPSGPKGLDRPLGERVGGFAATPPSGPTGAAGVAGRGRGLPIRGMAGGRGGMPGHAHAGPIPGIPSVGHAGAPGFRPRGVPGQVQPGQPGQPGMMGGMGGRGFPGQAQGQGFMPPGQQEMMAQMMMMQANMAQMGQMMSMMVDGQGRQNKPHQGNQRNPRPPHGAPRPPPANKPHPSTTSKPSKTSGAGAIPDKPSSTALCKYGVGCSNARCIYSHPSPVADEMTGMVLSEEACEKGKGCKDMECVKSHVSPAAVLGGEAGPSRLLCKYQNCSNPSCPFRHEDENGNLVPPPALTNPKPAPAAAAANGNGSANGEADGKEGKEGKGIMDGQLDDGPKVTACRYGERCTRADCKFTHPASRPTPKAPTKTPAKKPFTQASAHAQSARPAVASSALGGIAGGMSKSKKFGAPAPAANGDGGKKLDPAAGEFKPASAAAPAAPAAEGEAKDEAKELEVSS
ncbi:hypothetical protein IAT38_002928 [Cryptococcus sp. DSM 104549]